VGRAHRGAAQALAPQQCIAAALMAARDGFAKNRPPGACTSNRLRAAVAAFDTGRALNPATSLRRKHHET
jgi:hypothetical protein